MVEKSCLDFSVDVYGKASFSSLYFCYTFVYTTSRPVVVKRCRPSEFWCIQGRCRLKHQGCRPSEYGAPRGARVHDLGRSLSEAESKDSSWLLVTTNAWEEWSMHRSGQTTYHVWDHMAYSNKDKCPWWVMVPNLLSIMWEARWQYLSCMVIVGHVAHNIENNYPRWVVAPMFPIKRSYL